MTTLEATLQQIKEQFVGDKFSTTEISNFKRAQKLAYIAAEFTSKQLVEGMTEKQAANIMENFLKDQEVEHFFHHSFVWFGERSRFKGFSTLPLNGGLQNIIDGAARAIDFGLPHFGTQFLPSNKTLEKDMVVILDVAPVVNGCAADIGFSFVFGENSEATKAIQDLAPYRDLILSMVKQEKYLSDIYSAVDQLILEQGYENIHKIYPGEVLGHKVGKLPFLQLPATNVMGFDAQSLAFLFAENLRSQVNDVLKGGFNFITNGFNMADLNTSMTTQKAPIWGPKSNFIATEGLWALEPHIGKNTFGVKWEEILVITSNNAYWLDDDLPHVNTWKNNQNKNQQGI